MASAPSLPSGRVTFAFVDVVGSTRTFHEHGDAYVAAQRALHTRVAHHAERSGGVVVATEGDGAFLAFGDAPSAVSALVALQDELETADGDGLHLRLRSGAHTGDAVPVDGNYLAVAVHVAARVAGTANAGQVLVTDAVVEDLSTFEPVELGTYELKDLPEPTRIWRVAGDPTPPRATPARRTNVQLTRTSFVGRAEDLDRLRDLVAAPGLVTVVGPGGTGKTRLVSELALSDADTVPGGVWLAELAALDSPDQILGAVGAALGTPADLEQVTDLLRLRSRCVVVLDNCEHLLDAVAELAESLLDACPDLTVLCTSREALNLAGERVWALPPLPVDGAATQLFLDRATGVTVDPPELGLVHRLCAALDGLPLAIELAAGQARAAPLRVLLDVITAGTDALERRGGDTRQRSLDAVLEWSLTRLDPRVRTSLLVLSLFPGRFSPEMARTVLSAVPQADPQALRVLTRGSLVDLDGADYRLLWTIRDAARRQLDQDPDLRRAAREALAGWAGSFGEERFAVLAGHQDVADDTLLAVEAALDHGLSLEIHGLGLAWYLLAVTAGARGVRSSTHALARRALRVAPTDRDSVYVLTAGVHILESHFEDSEVSTDIFRTMAAIAEAADDSRLLVAVLFGMAIHEGNLGHWASSVSVLHEALVVTERSPEARADMPTIVAALGHAHYFAGDGARSIEYNLLALESGAEHGRWDIVAVAHLNLAERALIEDRRAEARDHALAVLKETPPNYRFRGSALATLARALSRLGDPESALAAGRQALELLDAQHHDVENREERDMLLAELPELSS